MADMTSGNARPAPGARAASGGPRADQAQRRVFSAAYKLRILAEYEGLDEHGARAALLRREGLYDSHLRKWMVARDKGALGGDAKVTPEPVRSRPGGRRESAENRRLRADNARLTAELAKTKAMLEVMGKAHALFEILSESADTRTLPR